MAKLRGSVATDSLRFSFRGVTEYSEFGSAVREAPPEESWDKIVAGFLGVTTFELGMLVDAMRKSVSELVKQRERYELQIERKA